LAPTRPNVWQLKHWVREDWDLYASTLMQMWQRVDSLKISWDFWVLGMVTRNKTKIMGFESSVDRRAEDISLTLMTSKPRSTSPSDISFAEVLPGRWRNTEFTGFSDIGKKVK
jgi:hypothetical protein